MEMTCYKQHENITQEKCSPVIIQEQVAYASGSVANLLKESIIEAQQLITYLIFSFKTVEKNKARGYPTFIYVILCTTLQEFEVRNFVPQLRKHPL